MNSETRPHFHIGTQRPVILRLTLLLYLGVFAESQHVFRELLSPSRQLLLDFYLLLVFLYLLNFLLMSVYIMSPHVSPDGAMGADSSAASESVMKIQMEVEGE